MHETKNGKEINWETFKRLQINYYEHPFFEIKARNIPMGKSDGNGNPIRMNSTEIKVMEDNIKKNINENYNPLEINYRINYK